MSRSKTCPDCAAKDAEIAKWKQDYKDLALAIAQRDGYGVPGTKIAPVLKETHTIPALAPLPGEVMFAIEGTTEAYSQARFDAVVAAREMLERGATIENVAEQIRLGAEVKV